MAKEIRVNLGVPMHHLHRILMIFPVNESFGCNLNHPGRNSHTAGAGAEHPNPNTETHGE